MRSVSFRVVRSLVARALSCAVVLAAAAPAHGASNNQWSVAPYYNGLTTGPRDWFEYTLKPSQTLTDMVAISNLSGEDKTFLVYATDAYNTPADGAFALLLRKDKPTDAGTWVHLAVTRITIPKDRRAAVPFEIRIPTNAEPGDHAAGIVVEDTAAPISRLASGRGLLLHQRVASRVYIRVAGPLNPALEVTQIAVKPHKEPLTPWGNGATADIGFIVKNVGNVRLAGQAQLTMKGRFGRTLKTFRVHDVPELLPHGEVAFTERWVGLPYLDRVTASVHVTALENTVNVTRTKTLWVGPWLPIVLALIIVALLLLGWRYWRRWRRRRKAAEPEGTPPTPAPTEEPVSV